LGEARPGENAIFLPEVKAGATPSCVACPVIMRILFFAYLKDMTGQASVEWKMDRSLDAEELWQRLMAAYPKLTGLRNTVRLARNCEYAGPETRFSDGDEVALIPPVSGG
jgi:molybdopterin converting factor subunit 1